MNPGRRRATFAGMAAALVAAAALIGSATASAAFRSISASHSFAGLRVYEPKTHIKSAGVSFVVPTITCKKNFSGVGPSVLIDSTVHKNTYNYSGGGVAVVCQNRVPTYVALPIVDSVNYDDFNVAIAAGNKITMTVRYGTNTAVTLKDDTTGQVDKRSGKRSVGETAYFGDSGIEINHKGVGIDPFTKTSFSGASVNGHAIGSESPKRYRWVDSHGTVLVTSSALSHRADFTTTFQHSS